MVNKIFGQSCSTRRVSTPCAGARYIAQNIYYLVRKSDRVEASPAALICLRDGTSPEEPTAEVMLEQPGASRHEFAPLNLTVLGSEFLGAIGAAP